MWECKKDKGKLPRFDVSPILGGNSRDTVFLSTMYFWASGIAIKKLLQLFYKVLKLTSKVCILHDLSKSSPFCKIFSISVANWFFEFSVTLLIVIKISSLFKISLLVY